MTAGLPFWRRSGWRGGWAPWGCWGRWCRPVTGAALRSWWNLPPCCWALKPPNQRGLPHTLNWALGLDQKPNEPSPVCWAWQNSGPSPALPQLDRDKTEDTWMMNMRNPVITVAGVKVRTIYQPIFTYHSYFNVGISIGRYEKKNYSTKMFCRQQSRVHFSRAKRVNLFLINRKLISSNFW